MSDDRLTALEELTAHQALTVEELSGELAEQWKTIRQLERQVKALAQHFADLEEAATTVPENKRPPHW